MSYQLTLDRADEKNRSEWIKFSKLVDHASLNKHEVQYDSEKRIVRVYLTRKLWKERKLFWFTLSAASSDQMVRSLLTIHEVNACNIEDEHAEITEVNIGIAFKKTEIYIGSSCEHGNGYGINLMVKRIKVTLEDQK